MRQEYNLKSNYKESQLMIGTILVIIIPFFIFSSFPDLRDKQIDNSFFIICGTACVFSILEGLFLIYKVNNTHLVLSENGIEYTTPTMIINIPWNKVHLIEVRYRYGRKYAIVSSETRIKRKKIWKNSSSNLEKLMPEAEIPVSDFLSDDMEKILEVMSAYPEFQNKP